MRATLFHFKGPVLRDHLAQGEWSKFRAEARKTIGQTIGVESLSQNVWLIDETDTLNSSGRLVSLAHAHQIAYRTLQFDLESEWQDHHPVAQE